MTTFYRNAGTSVKNAAPRRNAHDRACGHAPPPGIAGL
jgi:hypothetical protein